MKNNFLKTLVEDFLNLTNKFVKVAIVIFVAAFALGFLSGAITEYSLATKNKIVTEIYTVKQGDTLMDICVEYRKRDCRDPYILEYVDEIKKLNPNLNNFLQVGEEIKIQYKEKL